MGMLEEVSVEVKILKEVEDSTEIQALRGVELLR